MATTEPHADTRPLLHHSTGRDLADIRPPVILLFSGKPATQFAAVLSDWSNRTSDQPLKNAIAGLATQGAR
ncbi:hypothetical protein CKJ64_11725 [Mycobacterium avium]|nr:hypothetical protein CKJ64_11725 [Mycobacterium avium]